MTTLEKTDGPVAFVSAGELDDLQLSVARRADQLARSMRNGRADDRRIWLRAEWEVFERAGLKRRRRWQPAGSVACESGLLLRGG